VICRGTTREMTEDESGTFTLPNIVYKDVL
jgi:hypothetical protein